MFEQNYTVMTDKVVYLKQILNYQVLFCSEAQS